MYDKKFKAMHMNVTREDLSGNRGIGRYIFMPGSTKRAAEIAEHFQNRKVKEHGRGHHFYYGTIQSGKQKIDVASISSGMGTPSVEIILNELIKLGGKRFLRLGTCGSLQPHLTRLGDMVIGTASVRDEGASRAYVPLEFPAVASLEIIEAAKSAAEKLKLQKQIHTGILHSKDALYAREFGEGPMAKENKQYTHILEEAGVLASEMEAALLFILTTIYDRKLGKYGKGPAYRILSGAICAIIGNGPDWASPKVAEKAVDQMIAFGLETVKQLAMAER